MCSTFERAILPQLCRVVWDSYTLSDWSPFCNQLKNEQLQTDNYNCQISHIFIFFLWAFFNPLEDLPGYPIPVPGNAGNCILESNFTSFPGGGACCLTSLRVGASGTKRSRQRRERCTSASWNTASGTSKCNRKAWFSTPNLLWSKAIVVYWV